MGGLGPPKTINGSGGQIVAVFGLASAAVWKGDGVEEKTYSPRNHLEALEIVYSFSTEPRAVDGVAERVAVFVFFSHGCVLWILHSLEIIIVCFVNTRFTAVPPALQLSKTAPMERPSFRKRTCMEHRLELYAFCSKWLPR